MAFAEKTDYVGLQSNVTGLVLRSNTQNASSQRIQLPKADGSILGWSDEFGEIKAPTCEYAISAKCNLSSLNLGVVHGTNGAYALSRIHIATGPGTEPTVQADSVQIENNATSSVCTYKLDNIEISPARHALDFGSFKYTETSALVLQASEFDAAVNLTPATVNGSPVASDSTEGLETVNVTFWTNDETTEPNVSATTGWTQTTTWTCTGADSSMYSWTATFSKPLSATVAE